MQTILNSLSPDYLTEELYRESKEIRDTAITHYHYLVIDLSYFDFDKEEHSCFYFAKYLTMLPSITYNFPLSTYNLYLQQIIKQTIKHFKELNPNTEILNIETSVTQNPELNHKDEEDIWANHYFEMLRGNHRSYVMRYLT